MTEVKCPWEYCSWNIGSKCTRHVLTLTEYDPNSLDCDQYEDQWEKDGCGNDKD